MKHLLEKLKNIKASLQAKLQLLHEKKESVTQPHDLIDDLETTLQTTLAQIDEIRGELESHPEIPSPTHKKESSPPQSPRGLVQQPPKAAFPCCSSSPCCAPPPPPQSAKPQIPRLPIEQMMHGRSADPIPTSSSLPPLPHPHVHMDEHSVNKRPFGEDSFDKRQFFVEQTPKPPTPEEGLRVQISRELAFKTQELARALKELDNPETPPNTPPHKISHSSPSSSPVVQTTPKTPRTTPFPGCQACCACQPSSSSSSPSPHPERSPGRQRERSIPAKRSPSCKSSV